MCYHLTLLENELSLSSYAWFPKKSTGFYSLRLFYKNLNKTPERQAVRASRFSQKPMELPAWTE